MREVEARLELDAVADENATQARIAFLVEAHERALEQLKREKQTAEEALAKRDEAEAKRRRARMRQLAKLNRKVNVMILALVLAMLAQHPLARDVAMTLVQQVVKGATK